MVWMGHGLVLAFFLAISTLAASARWNIGLGLGRAAPAAVTPNIGLVLVLCKSFGATLYVLLLVPIIRFAPVRLQVRFAFLMVVFAFSYPLLRSQDLVPTSLMLEAVDAISTERAFSLKLISI